MPDEKQVTIFLYQSRFTILVVYVIDTICTYSAIHRGVEKQKFSAYNCKYFLTHHF